MGIAPFLQLMSGTRRGGGGGGVAIHFGMPGVLVM